MNLTIKNSINLVNSFLVSKYSESELKKIRKELIIICGERISFSNNYVDITYDELQKSLSLINEKEEIRRDKGVYYTPKDVVRYILYNSIKFSYNILKPTNLHVMDLNGVEYDDFCFKKTVFDPTCGLGEFLIETLDVKLNLLQLHIKNISIANICKIVGTLYGNDINPVSICISKIRLLLLVLHRFGANNIGGIGKVLNNNFFTYDYISDDVDKKRYDIILGNPPYVEDAKSGLILKKSYGNIYANVLENVSVQLKKDGIMGFIIPISYVSTVRMKNIRCLLFNRVCEQYILNFNDRPDCLFTSVHQKLCIVLGKKTDTKCIYTSNYRYWYKEERDKLFVETKAVKNVFINDDYIPKLGTNLDVSIYKKVIKNDIAIIDLLTSGERALFVNMRATFWIKAFMKNHSSKEYKAFMCNDDEIKAYCMCLLNSSLFWWFWISVSDCWHITNKELNTFMVPKIIKYDKYVKLAKSLEEKLEETKEYVGTIQTDYEYKHKFCVDEIVNIDNEIANTFKLTDEENIYIKNFAYKYRIGGGAFYGCN